jgi:hypothetical protein
MEEHAKQRREQKKYDELQELTGDINSLPDSDRASLLTEFRQKVKAKKSGK